jgi:hypothetical protein
MLSVPFLASERRIGRPTEQRLAGKASIVVRLPSSAGAAYAIRSPRATVIARSKGRTS